jgi:hypothetical protein
MGQTGMRAQLQFHDGASGAVGECADTKIGRKYAANTQDLAVD